jgi:hypothetical protein
MSIYRDLKSGSAEKIDGSPPDARRLARLDFNLNKLNARLIGKFQTLKEILHVRILLQQSRPS